MKAFIKFNRGMLGMPVLWQVWVAVLVVANLVVPMFFLLRLESQVVLGALLVSLALTRLPSPPVARSQISGRSKSGPRSTPRRRLS